MCAHEYLWCTLCLMKISRRLLTPRSLRLGRQCHRKLHRGVKHFTSICWRGMVIVCGQELLRMLELVYISFPIAGAPKYVLQSYPGKISDCLPLFPISVVSAHRRESSKLRRGVTTLKDINDIRNGVFAMKQIHTVFDSRRVVILKVCHTCPPVYSLSDLSIYHTTNTQTPNHILQTDEIPERHVRQNRRDDTRCPLMLVIRCNGWCRTSGMKP